MKYLPYILIVIVLLLAAGFYLDRTSINSPLATDGRGAGGEGNKILGDGNLKNYGHAPEFTGITNWLNSQPLTMQELRGKVVLIDFWTYSCINCIRTLPFVTSWYEKYKDGGFVIVGVHTPEFEFEKVTANVETALKRYKINYPVAQDNNFATWRAYSNRFWPAHYLIDKEGNIVYTHFGEGKYEETENKIRFLLGLDDSENGSQPRSDTPPGGSATRVGSPEMYFGTARLENLSNSQKPSLQATAYRLPADIKLNEFALEGTWQFDGEKATLTEGAGKIRLKFSSGKVHMVAKADKTVSVNITVDEKNTASVEIGASGLYTLFDSENYKEHIIDIEIPEGGFEAFTFTFG